MPPPIETPKNVSSLTNRAAYIDQVLPDIKAFLSRFGGDFLYYKVWPSTDEAILLQSAEQEEQATSIDVVEQARNKEYCSREQQALARRVSGIAGEEDNGVAAPVLAQFPKASSAYGMIALQKALYNYLMAVAKPNHSWLLDDINISSANCGSDAFTAIDGYMAPRNDDMRREVKEDYDDYLEGLKPSSRLDKFLPELLRLGKTKQLFNNEQESKIVILEDMIAKMKAVDAQVKLTTKGQGTGWSTEITAWRLELAAAKLVQEFNDTAIVGHFETKLRSLQASADRAKAQAAKTGAKTFNFQDGGGYKALAVRKYDKPCSWCFENLGKEFYGHSFDECRNKTKKPPDGVPPDRGKGTGARACHLCGAGSDGTPFHPASACPRAADFKAFVQQRAQLVEQIVEFNKDQAGAASAAAGTDGQYSMSPRDTLTPSSRPLLPMKRVERPMMTCDFMDFKAYPAMSTQTLCQLDGASEDSDLSIEGGWVDIDDYINQGYWNEVNIREGEAKYTKKKAKPIYWPVGGKPHPLASCVCHTQPIPKKTKKRSPTLSPAAITPPSLSPSPAAITPPDQPRTPSTPVPTLHEILGINSRSMTPPTPRESISSLSPTSSENERALQEVAEAWMLNTEAINLLRDMHKRARALNKDASRCLRDRAAIDSGASETMTNNLALVSHPVRAAITVQQADGSNIRGTYLRGKLSAKANGIPLPKVDVIYNKNFETTLVSTPQLNSVGMEVILSPTFGSFMQPKGNGCPICIPHPDRINFDQTTRGTSLAITPGDMSSVSDSTPKTRHAIARLSTVGDSDGAKSGSTHEATTQTEKMLQVTSKDTIERIKLWHARLGGVSFERLQALSKCYPEHLKLPSTATFDETCQCCQRSGMRKRNAASQVTRMPKPMEEIHFDIFTYDGEYTLFLIDRGSRACWAYHLKLKSEVPRALQQFLIDSSTNDFPVGHFTYTLVSNRSKGIDAQAINAYLEQHGLTQRVRIFFADNAGEHESLDLEEFITQLNILHLSSVAGSQYQNALAEHAGGWRLGTAIRHDFDISGLGKGFLRYCVSLNAQRHNILPHSALDGKSPFSILYPDRIPPFELFKPFGCAATILKDAKDLRKKTQPRGLPGIYIGTSLPLGQHGYLIWVPQLQRIVTSTHAEFDEKYFPARSFQPRVTDFYATLPANQDAELIRASLRDISKSAPITTSADDNDPDDTMPSLIADSSDSEGENNDAEDDADDDFVIVHKESTSSELEQQASKPEQQERRHIPPETEYFDEFELNPEHPDSIYFDPQIDHESADEASAEITAESMAPPASTTRSGKVFGSANTAKAQYKPGFDIHEGREVDIKGYLSIGNDDLNRGGVVSYTFLARVMVKALKAFAKDNPNLRKEAAKEIALLRNPKTIKEALESPQRKEWIEAIRKEMKSLVDKRVFEIKKVPAGRKVIPLRLVLKIKLSSDGTIDKFKARCVVAGFRQTAGLDYDPQGTYSPMTEPTTLRCILSMANELDLELDHLDIKTAFLNAGLAEKERFYCSPPPGFRVPAGYGLYVTKGLYGAHQSGAAWAATFRDWMRESAPEFKEAGNERCVYVMRMKADGEPVDLNIERGMMLEEGEKLVIIVMNTDDMLIAYTKNAKSFVDNFEHTLNKSFEATPREEVEYYMGMHIIRDRERKLLGYDARRHVYNFIWHMGRSPDESVGVSTPLDPHETYTKEDCPPEVNTKLREKVWAAHGILIHLSIWARPDLAHAVSVLGRYVHNPSEKLWAAYDRIAKYLIKTRDFRVLFGTLDKKHGQGELYAYSDSDWGGSIDDRRSTSAYTFFLGGAAISWKVKLSPTVCLSTQEAEYVGMSEATKEALNLRMLLKQLGFGSPAPTTIYGDNHGAITMGLHPANKPATRHIDMRRHFLRQHVELKNVTTPYVKTDGMVVDCMTKQTPRATHTRHFGTIFGAQDSTLPLKPIVKLVE